MDELPWLSHAHKRRDKYLNLFLSVTTARALQESKLNAVGQSGFRFIDQSNAEAMKNLNSLSGIKKKPPKYLNFIALIQIRNHQDLIQNYMSLLTLKMALNSRKVGTL